MVGPQKKRARIRRSKKKKPPPMIHLLQSVADSGEFVDGGGIGHVGTRPSGSGQLFNL